MTTHTTLSSRAGNPHPHEEGHPKAGALFLLATPPCVMSHSRPAP
jgi:hypothetical protein